MMYPIQRTAGLIIEELAGEAVIYDEKSHRAHCLNRSAAAIWRRCDGQTTPEGIQALLSAEFGSPVDLEVVKLALKDLAERGLLKSGPKALLSQPSRRRAVQNIAAGSAIAFLPAITSILAPTPAMAQSADRHDNGGGGGKHRSKGRAKGHSH